MRNKGKFLASISEFIKMGRHEQVSARHIASTMHVADITWLSNVFDGDFGVNCDKRVVLEQFVQWIYEAIIIPLLRCSFYITETEGSAMEVFYYTRENWCKVHRAGHEILGDKFIKVCNWCVYF